MTVETGNFDYKISGSVEMFLKGCENTLDKIVMSEEFEPNSKYSLVVSSKEPLGQIKSAIVTWRIGTLASLSNLVRRDKVSGISIEKVQVKPMSVLDPVEREKMAAVLTTDNQVIPSDRSSTFLAPELRCPTS